MDPKQLLQNAQRKAQENKKFLTQLKRQNPSKVDMHFHALHDEVFEEIDCLTCANCCKTTSPIFYETDIERVSRSLRMKPGDFVEKYLRVDEDKDFVLKSSPCPFLGPDNLCAVYEDRPKACREYPHTNRKKMVQVLDLAYKNTFVCPAVVQIVERMRKAFASGR